MRYVTSIFLGLVFSFLVFFTMTLLIERDGVMTDETSPELELDMIDYRKIEKDVFAKPKEIDESIPKPEFPDDVELNMTFTTEMKKLSIKPIMEDISILDMPNRDVMLDSTEETLFNKQEVSGSKYVVYPERALEESIEGYVYIENTVNQYGRVIEVRIIESFPEKVFDLAVEKAALDWEYGKGNTTYRKHRVKVDFVIKTDADDGFYSIVNRD